MARKRVVSRTVRYTEVEALVVNLSEEKLTRTVISIPGHKKTLAAVESYLKKNTPEGIKVVNIIDYREKVEKRYMTEEFYIRNSIPVTPDYEIGAIDDILYDDEDSDEEDEEVEESEG